MQRKMLAMSRTHEGNVAALLGPRTKIWEEYQATVAACDEVDRLRGLLGTAGSPLTDFQSNQILSAFTAEHVRTMRADRAWDDSAAATSPDFLQEGMQRTIDSHYRLVVEAAAVLTHDQAGRYKRDIEQRVIQMQTVMRMMTSAGKP